jgi:hypothetical protein
MVNVSQPATPAAPVALNALDVQAVSRTVLVVE